MKIINLIIIFITLTFYSIQTLSSGGLTEPFFTIINDRCIELAKKTTSDISVKLIITEKCKKNHINLHSEKKPSLATHTVSEYLKLMEDNPKRIIPQKNIITINKYCNQAVETTSLIYKSKKRNITELELLNTLESSTTRTDIISNIYVILTKHSINLAFNKEISLEEASLEIQNYCEKIYKSMFGY